jgi:hypothetical protein
MLFLLPLLSLHGAAPPAPPGSASNEEFVQKRRELSQKEQELIHRRRMLTVKRASADAEAARAEEAEIDAQLEAVRAEQRSLTARHLGAVPFGAGGPEASEHHAKDAELAARQRALQGRMHELIRKRSENPTDDSWRNEEEKVREELEAVRIERRKFREEWIGRRRISRHADAPVT